MNCLFDSILHEPKRSVIERYGSDRHQHSYAIAQMQHLGREDQSGQQHYKGTSIGHRHGLHTDLLLDAHQHLIAGFVLSPIGRINLHDLLRRLGQAASLLRSTRTARATRSDAYHHLALLRALHRTAMLNNLGHNFGN